MPPTNLQITIAVRNIPADVLDKGVSLRWIGSGTTAGEIHDWPFAVIGTQNQVITVRIDNPLFPRNGHWQLQTDPPFHVYAWSTDFTWKAATAYAWDVATGQVTEVPDTITIPPPAGILDWLDTNVINQLPAPLNTRTGAAVGAVAALIAYRKMFGRRGLLG